MTALSRIDALHIVLILKVNVGQINKALSTKRPLRMAAGNVT